MKTFADAVGAESVFPRKTVSKMLGIGYASAAQILVLEVHRGLFVIFFSGKLDQTVVIDFLFYKCNVILRVVSMSVSLVTGLLFWV